MRNLITILIISVIGTMPSKSQDIDTWVNQKYEELSFNEKLGQLFMIRAFSRNEDGHYKKVEDLINKYKPGGICFFQGSPKEQAQLVNKYQTLSDIPMLIAIDGEWGVGMRFPGQVISFPRQLTLGAIQNENLIYEMGEEVARQCKLLGIHVNFAPVVDVNNNPANPVINNRSFGEDIYNVSAKGFAYMKGMQDHGIMASAKHFPGHGDTDVDSHADLPVINHSQARLDSLELMPFQVLIDQGVASIMVAHMDVPTLDNRKNRPTTLSAPVINGLLKEKMGFEGIVFTDAMEMQGVLKHFPTGIAEAEALVAGNDMIVLSMDIQESFEVIKKYISEGKITMDDIEEKVKKILRSKYKLGIHRKADVLNPMTVDSLLNRKEALALKHRLVRESITLLNNDSGSIPVRIVSSQKMATISIGYSGISPFQHRISDYKEASHISLNKDISSEQQAKILTELKDYDHVIIGIHDMSKFENKDFGITPSARALITALSAQNAKVTIVLFGSPYALKYFQESGSVIVAYEDDEVFQDLTAQAIFGASNFRGKLPVSVGKYPYGTGIQIESIGRLGYDVPENVGMSSEGLASIDSIVDEMISKKAAPGCQVLVAKDGKIVFEKSYGHFTYDNYHPVQKNDVYDVASVTKVMATTLSLMKLVDNGLLNVKDPVAKYIPQLDTTDKKTILFDEMLAHHAKFIGWIPFYLSTISENRSNPKPLTDYYSKRNSGGYNIPVARNLYLRSDYRDSIWSKIYGSKLRENEGYRYSDLAFYLSHQAIQNVTGKGVDIFAYENFYFPLGLSRTGFNPYRWMSVDHIAPSEEDVYFRRQRLQGYVHDMGAAMLGGVSGHAGLFSNSKELAVLMQMLLSGGSYGGERYLSEEVIELFTKRYYKSSRRGLGFDMKELDQRKNLNMSEKASESAFGHLGFTGTAVFADPQHNLIYIFLSNRTYPRMQNNKLSRYEYRPRIQTAIYNSLIKDTLP